MPGFLTHYIAGKAALNGVSPQIREKIAEGERLYNLGTQGPDIFFYYFPGQILKRSRGIAQDMHLGSLGLFLGYMARLAKDAPGKQERDTIFSYTAGFMMHYVVDCHAHPYVYARAFNPNNPKIINSAEHRKFETAIDVALLKLTSGQKPAGISQWELINAEKCQLSVAAAALSQGIKEVYHRDIPSKVSKRALKFTITATRFLQSKNGKRKRFMELVENLTLGVPLNSSLIHMQEITGDDDYLNIKKSPWHAPWAPDEEFHNDSFVECYQAAIDEGIDMLNALYSFVYGNLNPIALAEVLGNRSLKTGLPCAA